jgi:hypothetical protein
MLFWRCESINNATDGLISGEMTLFKTGAVPRIASIPKLRGCLHFQRVIRFLLGVLTSKRGLAEQTSRNWGISRLVHFTDWIRSTQS